MSQWIVKIESDSGFTKRTLISSLKKKCDNVSELEEEIKRVFANESLRQPENTRGRKYWRGIISDKLKQQLLTKCVDNKLTYGSQESKKASLVCALLFWFVDPCTPILHFILAHVLLFVVFFFVCFVGLAVL